MLFESWRELPASPLLEQTRPVCCRMPGLLLMSPRPALFHAPPTFVHDFAIALVESVYAEILSQGNDVVMIDAMFEDRGAILRDC
jgi:hypothetical protein